ncbi:50S ribosomal protein L11 methyltransferase [Crocinitomix algicola]|uniref:50S ribosomal protein L11 methyltransferase n=1 Tax=Crocinitomix algicola TaxID=1740263 RepID=UPI00082FF1BD|nr:50S ribosomal protein L11 methyltransferase [Crocinitomix algicola]
MNYTELNIELKTIEPWRDILVSVLAERGYESFVETKSGLQSYIPEQNFNIDILAELDKYEAIEAINHRVIEDENWNAAWEENFDPVFVEDKLAILAPFHNQDVTQKMVIQIQPQMSFGTGHHQTTWLASKRLFELNLEGKDVLDMGTGTGILAILSEKLGARSIYAPDIDTWSYENAKENVTLNNCKRIEVALGDDQLLTGKSFDLIIANINKNILIQHFKQYAAVLRNKGNLLISGFFETDQLDLKEEAQKYGFVFERIDTKDEWALMQFIKNET